MSHKILFIYMAFFLPVIAFSQQGKDVSKEYKPFARVISTDATKNYISVDLTQLPGFFERAYLLDLIFADSGLVVNNSNIKGTTLDLYSNKENEVMKVINTLDEFLKKAISAGKTLNSEQKNELLKKYAKYR